jgi:hypothetical protein
VSEVRGNRFNIFYTWTTCSTRGRVACALLTETTRREFALERVVVFCLNQEIVPAGTASRLIELATFM